VLLAHIPCVPDAAQVPGASTRRVSSGQSPALVRLIGARGRRTSSAHQCTASVDEELFPCQRHHSTFGRGSRGCLGGWIAHVRLKTRWEDGGTSRRELELEVVPQMRRLLHCVVPCTTVPVQLRGCSEHNRPHLPLNSVSRAKIGCLASVKHLFSKERSLFGEH
jgi:hypothetical protein